YHVRLLCFLLAVQPHHSHPMLMGINRIAVAMITRLMLNLRATLRIPDMDEGRATRAESLRFQTPPEESREGSVL
ncbi:hypothetical protein C8R45DRAFT_1023617, partial [Mycena sanguinolenta]